MEAFDLKYILKV